MDSGGALAKEVRDGQAAQLAAAYRSTAYEHENRNAFTVHADFLEAPRKTGNRVPMLSKCQAAVFTDQRQALGSPSSNILQRVKDRGIIWRVCGNSQFHARHSISSGQGTRVDGFPMSNVSWLLCAV